MSGPTEDGPTVSYASIQAVKSELGSKLMEQHGAHAIGITRPASPDGTRDGESVLTLYVEPGALPEPPVPTGVEHTPAGHATSIWIPLRFVERPRMSRGA